MTEYWQTAWLIGLTLITVALAAVVALDLKREWRRTSDPRIRRLIRDALQEQQLEQETGSHRIEVARAEPDPEVVSAIHAHLAAEPDTAPTPSAAMRDPDAPAPRPSDLLVPPPMVGPDTLRDWLIHYRQDREAWTEVVEAFYTRAAQDPEIADYFVGVDWPRLQRHFTAALVLLTHTGVTRDLPATAARWHSDVCNSDGDPITPDIFDAVIETLVGVLRDYDVPEDTLGQLAVTVAPFRMAIARMPAPAAEATARAAWPSWRDQRGPSVNDGGA
jgi:hemoglobin